MNYREKILNKLLDKYDNSFQSRDTTAKARTISLRTDKEKIFEKYWCADCYNYRPEVHDAVNELSKEGFVLAEYDKQSEVLKRVTLKLENVGKAFDSLKRSSRREVTGKEIAFINARLSTFNDVSIAYKYLSEIKRLIESGHSYRSQFRTIDELTLLSDIVAEIEKNEEEILLRNFSKKKFKDSKIVENNAARLLRIFNTFDEKEYVSFAELCSDHYLVKNKGYVYVKYGFCFKLNEQIVDLDCLKEDFSFSESAIDKIEIISVNKEKVITIENLTTFHYYNEPNSIIIYLGGYHNSVKRKLLEKLYSFNPQLKFYHIGDIDWGGFEIFLHLKRKTGINFIPLMMGMEELIKYKGDCSPLTENDRRHLSLLLQNPEAHSFYPVIEFMLKNGYKLEQESLIFN